MVLISRWYTLLTVAVAPDTGKSQVYSWRSCTSKTLFSSTMPHHGYSHMNNEQKSDKWLLNTIRRISTTCVLAAHLETCWCLGSEFCDMKAAPKVMSPVLLWWPMTSVTDICGIAVEGQSDKVASDMGVCMKKRCVSLNSSMTWRKMAPIDIHRCLLKIYGDQTVDVSTVR